MTRCAFEHDRGRLLFYRRGKICDLIVGERSKDKPACPGMRAGSFQSTDSLRGWVMSDPDDSLCERAMGARHRGSSQFLAAFLGSF
jgi:hypothetical protein